MLSLKTKLLTCSAFALAVSLTPLFGCSAHAETTKQLPIEDFFRQPEKTRYSISPDGKHFSWLQPWKEGKGRMNVMVADIDSPDEGRRITGVTERDIGDYGWVSDHHIMYATDSGGDENFHLYLKDINDDKEPVDVTPFKGVRAMVADWLREDPDHILVAMNKDNPQVFDIYKLDLNTHKLDLVAKNPGNITNWGTDHEGVVRLAWETNGVDITMLYRDKEGEEFKPLMTSNFEVENSVVGFTPDNKKLYFISDEGRDKPALYELDPHTKSKTLIFETDKAWGGIGGIFWSDKRKKLTGCWWQNDKQERHYFDDQAKKLFEDLKALRPDREVSIVDRDREETKYIVALWNDRDPGSYWFYDTEKPGELKKLAEVYPWLPTDRMAEMKPVSYKARDGRLIRGYLTVPKDSDGKNLPLVVNPHGGPEARDYWTFNPEVQMLANRGIAVFQPNYRVSTGFGRDFWKAGFKQWGQAQQDDITDGVKYLIEQGIADPKRIAIYGASYGGYATLMGLIKTPELYCCGVDYVGVSDITTLLDSVPEYWKPMREMMKTTIGDPDKDAAMLKEYSPIYHADKIVAPLFIAQGANDPRVIKKQSDDMVAAMKARGVEVEYMVKDNEGHGFHNEENRMDFYRHMVPFLEKHLGLPVEK